MILGSNRADALQPRQGGGGPCSASHGAPTAPPSLRPLAPPSVLSGRQPRSRPCSALPAAGGNATEADIQRLLKGPRGCGADVTVARGNGNGSGNGNGNGSGGLVLPPRYQRERRQAGADDPVAGSGAGADTSASGGGGKASEADGRTLPPLFLGWCGSGIYFWWQLGAYQYLASRYDLGRVPQAGASGGALCAALARCGVDPGAVIDSAYRLSVEHRIWERPLGLIGVWGRIIEAWLAELLPDDAAARCSGGLGVVVTELPGCRQVCIDNFDSKDDLINCCLASAHVPLLLDLKPARDLRGRPCVDGSFPDFFLRRNSAHLERGGDALVFDYCRDPAIQRSGRMDMLQLKEYSEIKRIALLGARYAQRLEEEGALARFDTAPVLRAQAPAPAVAAAAVAAS